jgi:hypothetical protein
VPDRDSAAQLEPAGQRSRIPAEIAPVIWRRGFRTAAVPARIVRDAPSSGKARDDLGPAMQMEASRVQKKNRGLGAGPFPDVQLEIAYCDS